MQQQAKGSGFNSHLSHLNQTRPDQVNFNEGHLNETSSNSKEIGKIGNAQQESFVKKETSQPSIRNMNKHNTQSALDAQYEARAQNQQNNGEIQPQITHTQRVQPQVKVTADKPDLDRAHLDKENHDHPHLNKENLKHPSPQSAKAFVEDQLKNIDQKIKAAKKPLVDQKEILQGEQKAAQEKTLGGAAVKNLATSAGEGIFNVVKDVNEAVKKLPPEPPIFP